MRENMKYYDMCKAVPEEAKKTIAAGKLKGFTDINPMWRIKKLTEMFGPCGIGWYTDNVKYWTEEGKGGKVAAFCELELFVKDGEEWSKPIRGVGGSMLVNVFKGAPETSDECYKMAYTDAISVACKALGMGADVYWDKGRETKYDTAPMEEKPLMCLVCGAEIEDWVDDKGKTYTSSQISHRTGGLCRACGETKKRENKTISEMRAEYKGDEK